MADGDDFLSGLLNLPQSAIGGLSNAIGSIGNGLGDAFNSAATDTSGLLGRFLPSSGQAQGLLSDPMRMALLQAGIGASQPSTTKAGVYGNMASGFGQGLMNSQDQALKRQLMQSEIQKNNQAVLPQVTALVQAGILPQSVLQKYLPPGTQMNPQGGAAPGGQSQPGAPGASGGAPGGITGSPLPPPPGAQSVGYQGGSSSPVNPQAQPNVSSQNVAPSSPAAIAAHYGIQTPLDPKGQEDLRNKFIEEQLEKAKQARENAAAGPVAFDKESAKADLTQAAALAGGRELGQKMLATNAGVKQVLDSMADSDFGPQGTWTAGAANALQSAGFDTSRPKREILEALQNRMKEQALAGINNDRLSESEGKGSRAIPPEMAAAIDKSIGSMDLSKKGLQGLADISDQAANQLVKRGDFAEKYRDENNGRWDYKGQGRLNREVDAPFRLNVAKSLAGSAPAAPAAQPQQAAPAQMQPVQLNGKTYFKGPDGKWYGAN